MENDDPWFPLLIERQSGETQLFAKQVTIEEQRYIVCRNEKEAEKDRKDREAIVAALDAQLRKGDKAVGNWACRHETKDERTFKLQKSGVQVGFGTTVKPGKLEVLDIPRLGDGRPPDETRRQLHQLASWSSTLATKREISPSDANSLGWSRSTACSISRAVLRPSQ